MNCPLEPFGKMENYCTTNSLVGMMVGTTNKFNRATTCRTLLDEEALSTVLLLRDSSLNSRPFIHEHGENNTKGVLIPVHFLTVRKLTAIPTLTNITSEIYNNEFMNTYRRQHCLLNMFRKKYSKNIYWNYVLTTKYVISTNHYE